MVVYVICIRFIGICKLSSRALNFPLDVLCMWIILCKNVVLNGGAGFFSVSFLVSSLSSVFFLIFFLFFLRISFAIYYSHEFSTNEDITFHFQLKCDCMKRARERTHIRSTLHSTIIYIFFTDFSFCSFFFLLLYFVCRMMYLFTLIFLDCSFYLNLFLFTFYSEKIQKKKRIAMLAKSKPVKEQNKGIHMMNQ